MARILGGNRLAQAHIGGVLRACGMVDSAAFKTAQKTKEKPAMRTISTKTIVLAATCAIKGELSRL